MVFPCLISCCVISEVKASVVLQAAPHICHRQCQAALLVDVIPSLKLSMKPFMSDETDSGCNGFIFFYDGFKVEDELFFPPGRCQSQDGK